MTNNKTPEMECTLASWFNYQRNLVVPNVHWGRYAHECDLLVLSQAGYATEVEIKVSLDDLRADKNKWHQHRSGGTIKFLYFAFPSAIFDKSPQKIIEHTPARAGILLVREKDDDWRTPRVHNFRKPERQPARRFTDGERYKLARLGALRIWTLKRKLNES